MSEHNETAPAAPVVDLSLIKGVDADHGGLTRMGQELTRGVIPGCATDTQNEENKNVPG
jgi:hypothetical protein